jgi:secondary thiamine-phosphate synthase enzyme
MHAQSLVLSCRSERAPQFVDITDEVGQIVADSAIRDGLVTVYSREPSTAIKINEHEPLLIEDLERLLDAIGAGDSLTTGRNGAMGTTVRSGRPRNLLGTSETIPLTGGQLQFGRWQRLFLIELGSPGVREVIIQIVGV